MWTCNSHAAKPSHSEAVRWLLVWSQSCVTINTINFRTFPHVPKKWYSQSLLPSRRPPGPRQPLTYSVAQRNTHSSVRLCLRGLSFSLLSCMGEPHFLCPLSCGWTSREDPHVAGVQALSMNVYLASYRGGGHGYKWAIT